jgi:hypothetical protein
LPTSSAGPDEPKAAAEAYSDGEGDRRERLRAQFDSLTRGLRGPDGRYRVPGDRWRRIVSWLLNSLIEVLLAAPRRFWGRLDSDEQRILRDFAKRLGLAPRSVAADVPAAERERVIRIVRKGLGLRA